MSRLISEPLANNTTKEFIGPLGIVNAPGNALAIAEVKLGKVAMKMMFFAMLIHTLHTTFEDGEKALHGIGMNGRISKRNILPGAMADGLMLRKMFFQIFVLTGIIGHNPGFMGDVLFQKVGTMVEALRLSITTLRASPDPRSTRDKNFALMGISTAFRLISLTPEKGFAHFHGAAIGAERSQGALSHSFTEYGVP